MGRTTAPIRAHLALAALLLAGCSAGAAATSDHTTTTPATSAAVTTPVGDAAAPAAKLAAEHTTTTVAPEPARVEIDVEVGPTVTVLTGDATGEAAEAVADPFGTFASCSGLRDSVAAWSLLVSDPSGEITAVSVSTSEPIDGPGTYDGFFRVEWVNGAALDDTGTITLATDLQSGSFTATEADLRGTFECTGGPSPTPLGDAAVTAFALLQRGTSQRIVSLAGPVEAGVNSCSADGSVVLTGDAGLGVSVAIAISPGGHPAIRLGGEVLPVDAVASSVTTNERSGTVHLEALDGTTVDAAYRCP